MNLRFSHFWYVALLAVFFREKCFAQNSTSAQPDRRSYQTELIDKRKRAVNILGSAPVSHIIPRNKAIYVAALVEKIDLTVLPASSELDSTDIVVDKELSLKGWTVSPFVAFAAKNFGVGFAAESGGRTVNFVDSQSAELPSAYASYTEHRASMRYSGVGVYGYVIPELRFIPKTFIPTVIVGGKNMAAVHEDNGTRTSETAEFDTEKLRYGVQKYEAGINVGITLVKGFTIFPWVHYERVYLGEVRDADGVTVSDDKLNEDVTLDRELMWTNDKMIRSSIDLAIRIARLDIHLGGLFGLIGGTTSGSDRIEDRSLTLTGSYQL